MRGTFEVILKRRTEEDFRSTHLADGLNEPDDSLAGSLAELDAIVHPHGTWMPPN